MFGAIEIAALGEEGIDVSGSITPMSTRGCHRRQQSLACPEAHGDGCNQKLIGDFRRREEFTAPGEAEGLREA